MERRLAAVLVADVVGYSRLMNEDEEGTLRAVKETFKSLIDPKVTQYNGRIIKLTGDGALMEFASAVDATAFAVEVQCAMRERNRDVPQKRRIEYRIGINIGDIIIDSDDIYGDGVNIAARLEALSETGGVCVAQNIFDQVKGKLDLTFEPLGKRTVKNIPEPISTYGLVLDEKAVALVTAVQPVVSRSRNKAYALVAGVTLIVAAVFAAWWQPWTRYVELAVPQRMAFALPDKPSIAVLPFVNMSDDRSQEYFSDGMTADLITDLSKVSGLFVISGNSTFTYKGKSMKVRTVAEELGVRYVLEGSVRRTGGRLRINTQLVDATTGGQVWAERYDRNLQHVFEVQDEVVRKIVSALQVRLTASEGQALGREHTKSVKAYDLYLRGRTEFARRTREGYRNATSLFQKAIELDPNFGRGYAYLAYSHARAFRAAWTSQPGQLLQQARKMLRKAIALDESLPLVYFVAGLVELFSREHEKSVLALEKALALDRNYADAYALLTFSLTFSGRPGVALGSMKKAMRLNPHHSLEYLSALGIAYFMLGRYEMAVNEFKKALVRNPTGQYERMWLAATYAKLGRIEDAEWEAQELLGLDPQFSLNRISKVLPFKDPAQLEVLLAGLRKAGLPN